MMKKQRRLISQVNNAAGMRVKHSFKKIQEELMAEKAEKDKQKLLNSGDNGGGVPSSISQSMADDTFDGLQKAKDEDYGDFRKDLKSSLMSVTGSLKNMVLDLQGELDKIENNPKWTDLSIEKKLRQLESISRILDKINAVERDWMGAGKKETQVHLHYNVPTNPDELTARLDEYDRILGRAGGMKAIAQPEKSIFSPPPGFQQRVLIETKPVEEEVKKLNSGEEE